jgi:hypothetical protein
MQGSDIYFGVDRRGVRALMPQQFTNLIERATLPEQTGGQGVPKHVGTFMRRLNARMSESAHDERGDS